MAGKKDYEPAMHTAEHILNQTMIRILGCGRSFNAHIEKKKSKCDYHFDRPLTREEIVSVEEMVNRVICENMPVTEHLISQDEAEERYFTGKLPADAGDRIRIVRVGDFDACPCIGRHVRSTAEIQGFRIVSTTYEYGVLRIRFVLKSTAAGT